MVEDQVFIEVCKRLQSTKAIAEHLGVSGRAVRKRKRNLEKKHNIVLPIFDSRPAYNSIQIDQKAIATFRIDTGTILIGSDAHIWPGPLTTMQRAFLWFAKKHKPDCIVVNGDMFDGAAISRHPSIGWEKKPSVQQELEAVQDYLGELLKASPNSKRFWPFGNHDGRLESRLAAIAPEYAGVKGVHLKDHIPGWIPCWRIDVNDDIVIKHRLGGGIHATHTNTLKAGKTIITGHLHSLKVTPWTDYLGTRFGCDTGTLAEPDGEQFINYLEAGPTNWRSGFLFLTFKNGRLLYPEIAMKFDDNSFEFRGEVIAV